MSGAEALIAVGIGSALLSTGVSVSQAFQGANVPSLPELPNLPSRLDLAGDTRSAEIARRAERRKRATTLLTGAQGAQVSPANVTKSLLGS